MHWLKNIDDVLVTVKDNYMIENLINVLISKDKNIKFTCETENILNKYLIKYLSWVCDKYFYMWYFICDKTIYHKFIFWKNLKGILF